MEIQNQNNINVTQERLDEMKATQKANQKILDDIGSQTAALNKAKSDFNKYKDIETQKIETGRQALARESLNHANLDTVQLQSQIDALTKENDDLKNQLQSHHP